MLYNIKTLPLHCVFHGIRFKVNEDWVSAIDTLLFFIPLALVAWIFFGHNPQNSSFNIAWLVPAFSGGA